jgi:LysR family nitrogen assimilation transcriptional regulator
MALDAILEIDSAEAIKTPVINGDGYTIFPPTAVAKEVAAGTLTAIEISKPRLTRRLVLSRSPSRIMNAGAVAVAELICELLNEN